MARALHGLTGSIPSMSLFRMQDIYTYIHIHMHIDRGTLRFDSSNNKHFLCSCELLLPQCLGNRSVQAGGPCILVRVSEGRLLMRRFMLERLVVHTSGYMHFDWNPACARDLNLRRLGVLHSCSFRQWPVAWMRYIVLR